MSFFSNTAFFGQCGKPLIFLHKPKHKYLTGALNILLINIYETYDKNRVFCIDIEIAIYFLINKNTVDSSLQYGSKTWNSP